MKLGYLHSPYLGSFKFILAAGLAASPGVAQTGPQINVTGKPISVNGATSIPEGIFGVHAGNFKGYDDKIASDWGIESSRHIQPNPGGSPASAPSPVKHVVTCWYDRYVPAIVLSNPSNWKTFLETKAAQFADAAKSSDKTHHLEFWNEPYLNWAYKPGVNTDPRFFDPSGAKAGDAVRIKGQTAPTKYLKWKMGQWYEGPSMAGDPGGMYPQIANTWNAQLGVKNIPYPGLEGALVEGEVYLKGTNREFTVVSRLRPYDPTQHSYYSGHQNVEYYNAMYEVVAKKVKAANPSVSMVGGWGFKPHVDGWKVWEIMYKPLIDQHHGLLDGIHDHHYGGNTHMDQAAYETIYSYALKKYGKRYRFYNTETGGDWDPAGGEGGTAPSEPTPKSMRAFTYNVRDMLFMASRSPDKAFTRAVHEPQNTEGGVEQAFRFLKPLRGMLIQAESSDNGIFTVASKNGNSLAVYLFNDGSTKATADLNVNAPAGQSLTGGKEYQPALSGSSVILKETGISVTGGKFESKVELDPRSSRAYVFTLSGTAQTVAPVSYVQFFADSILLKAEPGKVATVGLDISQDVLGKAKAARLKYALHEHEEEGGKVEWNGKVLPLESGPGTRYFSLDLSDLKARNELKITAGSGSSSNMWFTSVELVGEALPITVSAEEGRIPESFGERFQIVQLPGRKLSVRLGPGWGAQPLEAELVTLAGERIAYAHGTGEAMLDICLFQGLHLMRIRQGGRIAVRQINLIR